MVPSEKTFVEWAKNDNLELTENGYPIGVPTVKELIAILSKLPEDYRVYCCGAENYLWPGGKFCVSVFRQNQEYHVINVHSGAYSTWLHLSRKVGSVCAPHAA